MASGRSATTRSAVPKRREAPAELEPGGHLAVLGPAESLDLGHLGEGGVGQTAQPLELGEHLLRDAQRAGALDAGAQQDRDELGVAQYLRPILEQPLSWTLAAGQVVNARALGFGCGWSGERGCRHSASIRRTTLAAARRSRKARMARPVYPEPL